MEHVGAVVSYPPHESVNSALRGFSVESVNGALRGLSVVVDVLGSTRGGGTERCVAFCVFLRN